MTAVLVPELALHLQEIDLHPLDRLSLEMNTEMYNELHRLSGDFIILVNTHWWTYTDKERVALSENMRSCFETYKHGVCADFNSLSVAMRVALGLACKTISEKGREYFD